MAPDDTESTDLLSELPEVTVEESARPFLVMFHAGERRVVVVDRRLVLGRSREADVALDDPAVSRRHVAVTPHAGEIIVEDLASANGTYVNGQRIIEPAPIASGDIVTLGVTQLVAYRTGGPAPAKTFERRLDSEMDRALRYRRPLCVIYIDIADATRMDDATAAIDATIRAIDIAGQTSDARLAIVMPETTAPDAEATARSLIRQLADLRIETHAAVACFPDQAYDAASLRAAAEEAAQRGRPGDVIVAHTPFVEVSVAAHKLVFADPATVQLITIVRRLARTDLPMLITGETGAGKEIFARTLHEFSGRRGPFVAVNCPAIPEGLAESTLFGHARGAFTGAERSQRGLLESADGGTVFLDEVADMPMVVQAKLLRFLDDKLLTPVGALEPLEVDVRVVAATNRDLHDDMAAGRFRRDLYHRLSGAAVVVPALRERPRDLGLLIRRFADDACDKLDRPRIQLSAPAMSQLVSYSWPGNVRELRNVIEQAVALADGDIIDTVRLPVDVGVEARAERDDIEPLEAATAERKDLKSDLADLERKRILEALDQTHGNQTQAAKLLGISRMTLSQRLDAYGVARPRKHGKPDP